MEQPDLKAFLEKIRLSFLIRRYNAKYILAIFSFINGCISIFILSLIAFYANAPFIFPSLGPTAFLLFYKPTSASASPKNTLLGHFIGAMAGWLSLFIFNLHNLTPDIITDLSWDRMGSAALSLGATNGLMILFKVPHPPAAATTLIISLGIMSKLNQIPVVMGGVVFLLVQAFIINRMAGIDYPLWQKTDK